MREGDLVSDATYNPPIRLFVVTGRGEGDTLRVQGMSSLGGGSDVYTVHTSDLHVIQAATHHPPNTLDKSPATPPPVRG